MPSQPDDRFIQLALDLQRCSDFRSMVGLLCQRFPELAGVEEEGWVLSVSPAGNVLSIGRGREGEELARPAGRAEASQGVLAAVMREMDSENPDQLGVGLKAGGKAWRELKNLLPLTDACSDFLGGRLCANGRTRTLWLIPRKEGAFADSDRRLFDMMLLTARIMAERLAAGNVERQFRKLYLGSPPSAHAAVFLVHSNGDTLPINFEGIRRAEAWWGDDQAFGKIDRTVLAELQTQLALAWIDPVTAEFRSVEIPFGDQGPVSFMALPRPDGEIILLHFDASAMRGEDALNAVLTRRQKEIMGWIAEGKTSAEVAIILNISPRTVEKHLEAVFQRLGVENRIAAVRRYLDLRAGITD